jgi:hypothetical protein
MYPYRWLPTFFRNLFLHHQGKSGQIFGCRWIILEWRKEQAWGNKTIDHSEPGTTDRRYSSVWTSRNNKSSALTCPVLHYVNERLL